MCEPIKILQMLPPESLCHILNLQSRKQIVAFTSPRLYSRNPVKGLLAVSPFFLKLKPSQATFSPLPMSILEHTLSPVTYRFGFPLCRGGKFHAIGFWGNVESSIKLRLSNMSVDGFN